MVLSIFSYPRTAENAEHFKDWKCSVCHETDWREQGRTVAHLGGEQHPIHSDCIKEWMKHRPNCPSCKAALTLPDDSTFYSRSILWLQQTKNALMRRTEGAVTCITHPSNIGAICVGLGIFRRAHFFSALGYISVLYGVIPDLVNSLGEAKKAWNLARLKTAEASFYKRSIDAMDQVIIKGEEFKRTAQKVQARGRSLNAPVQGRRPVNAISAEVVQCRAKKAQSQRRYQRALTKSAEQISLRNKAFSNTAYYGSLAVVNFCLTCFFGYLYFSDASVSTASDQLGAS